MATQNAFMSYNGFLRKHLTFSATYFTLPQNPAYKKIKFKVAIGYSRILARKYKYSVIFHSRTRTL